MKYGDRAKRVRDSSFFPKSLEVCLVSLCCLLLFVDLATLTVSRQCVCNTKTCLPCYSGNHAENRC